MSPKTKAAAITAAAVAAVVAIVVVVLLNRERLSGTPIIIKGSSEPGQYVEIAGIPSTNDEEHTVSGAYTSIKIKGTLGKCMVYKFADGADFTIYLKTEPDFDEVYVDEKYFDYVAVEFDEKNRFNYSGNKFTSKDPHKVTGLTIEVPSASCSDAAGNTMSTCPIKFPNEAWTDLGNVEVSLGNGYACP